MKTIIWDDNKDARLREDKTRNYVGFEECLRTILKGRILDDLPNPSQSHPNQRILILDIENYAYVVPYVEDQQSIFLKTLFPSRKMTALYLDPKRTKP
jgi:hypothetical protein